MALLHIVYARFCFFIPNIFLCFFCWGQSGYLIFLAHWKRDYVDYSNSQVFASQFVISICFLPWVVIVVMSLMQEWTSTGYWAGAMNYFRLHHLLVSYLGSELNLIIVGVIGSIAGVVLFGAQAGSAWSKMLPMSPVAQDYSTAEESELKKAKLVLAIALTVLPIAIPFILSSLVNTIFADRYAIVVMPTLFMFVVMIMFSCQSQ